MHAFRVEGMTCAHCERAITLALRLVDPNCMVEIDREAGLVRTDSGAPKGALEAAIRAEGYQADRVAVSA